MAVHDTPAPTKDAFDYQSPTPEAIKTLRSALKSVRDTVLATVPPGRERALAITKLEEASMWGNKGIVFA